MIVHLQGHLGQNAETLQNQEQKEYHKLSIAEKTPQGEEPQWIKVFCHHLSTALVPHLTKGSFVSIVGRLTVSLYNGQPNIVVNGLDVQLLFSKKENES